MKNLLHSHSPFRIFAFSILLTLFSIFGTLWWHGINAAFVIMILIVVEIAFSFDNAIINAKTLAKLSEFWQKLFLTVGILIAVIGMRIIFPIMIVALSAGLGWGTVVDLALNHPNEYAEKLEAAYPTIAAFGGAFLLMLALEFFIDAKRKVVWLGVLEKPLQKIDRRWVPGALSILAVFLIALLPANHHPKSTIVAGLLGIATHIAIDGLTHLFGSKQGNKGSKLKPLTGTAAFTTFLYLEVLDASFSFDGVIGAFAVTKEILLIALGLGVGAIWVRSLTVYMVRKGTLKNYIYLEHGAHYTVGMLALILLTSIFFHVPEVVAGLAGISFITASIVASRRASQSKVKAAA